jgi:putative Mn2+ efflux pump MntP
MTSLLLLAFALAMDAFAVSLCQGAATRPTLPRALVLALAFGVAQAVMPLAGWALGVAFSDWIAAIDHWVAFVLLAAIGGKMAHEGLTGAPETGAAPLVGLPLLAAAVATSIDAAAAGITLPTLGVNIGLACLTIGVVTFALCVVGALGGARLGTRLGKRAEVLGGIVLIAIGTRILADHMGWW